MEEVTKRNFQTLSEGLKQQRGANSNQDAKINLLEDKLAQLVNQMDVLQLQLNFLKAQVAGHGPTSRK